MSIFRLLYFAFKKLTSQLVEDDFNHFIIMIVGDHFNLGFIARNFRI